jgi:hypothetical protein
MDVVACAANVPPPLQPATLDFARQNALPSVLARSAVATAAAVSVVLVTLMEVFALKVNVAAAVSPTVLAETAVMMGAVAIAAPARTAMRLASKGSVRVNASLIAQTKLVATTAAVAQLAANVGLGRCALLGPANVPQSAIQKSAALTDVVGNAVSVPTRRPYAMLASASPNVTPIATAKSAVITVAAGSVAPAPTMPRSARMGPAFPIANLTVA